MSRRHIAAASVMLGAAAVAGVLAATRTTQLGQAAAPPTPAALSARAAALDRAEARVRLAAAKRPPSLPPLAKPPATLAAPERVIVRRAQPTLVNAFHDGEHEEHEHGEHDHNEGSDD